jgi:hypothetical protein
MELVVEQVRARGDVEATARAERELPEMVDPDRHAELLRGCEVDPAVLVEGFGGQAPEVGWALGPGAASVRRLIVTSLMPLDWSCR